MAIRRRNTPSAEFSMASISDIVFLLLIYFLLASTFVTQSTINIQLPTSSSSRPYAGGNNITLSADGTLAWNNTKVSDKEDLRPYLEQILENENKDDDAINLRIDKRVTFEEAAGVMGLISQFDNAKLVILTERE